MSYDLMLKKAIDLQNQGALNQALDIYLKLLEVTPYNSDLWNLLGLISQSKGDIIKARDCFLSAIKYSVKPFGMYFFNLALCYKSLDDKISALSNFQKAVDLMPEVKEFWNYLGLQQIEMNELTIGIKSLCRALDIDENYKEARANLCYYSNDKEALSKLAKEDDSDFDANFLYGMMLEDAVEKEVYLRKAVNINADRVDVLLELADVLLKLNKIEEALQFYYKVLNLNDNNVRAILGVADIYLMLGEYKKSEEYYLKSFDLRRDIYGAYLNYGSLLYKEKRFSEALKAYHEVVKLQPENDSVCYNIALILKELNEYEEALGLMFNAYLKDKKNTLYQIGIAETLSDLFEKNAEMALKIASNWQKLDENNVFSKRILASISGINDENNDSIYVSKLFDTFADSYDDVISKLNPQIINKFKELNPNLKGKIIELGCGTGLAAEELVGENIEFFGVDISSQMIKIAESKNVYKKLWVDEIANFLSNNDLSSFDMVIAFDVFCYLGDLKNILKKLKGKEIWFSIENIDENLGKKYLLSHTGRYKHSLSYITLLKEELGFKMMEVFELDLRLEKGIPVKGCLIKLK